MRPFIICITVASAIDISTTAAQVFAQEPASAPDKPDPESRELYEKFEQTLGGVALVGHFTILGDRSKPLHEERYEIRSVSKMGSGDYWLFQARIKYGKHDLTVPLPLQVKWAGRTPVITLDNVGIPGLGTFNARVVIDGTMYAGTWSHGDVRGHLFGRIEKLASAESKAEANDGGK